MNPMNIIKSVRVYEENGIIKLDYRTYPSAILPHGKRGNRFRHSTAQKFSKIVFKSIQKRKFELAFEHYQSLFDALELKNIVLFEDIAYLALQEAEVNRRKVDGTKRYNSILKNHVLPFFGKMNIKDIKVRDVKAWMAQQAKEDLYQSTFNKRYYVVKRVMDYANENEYTVSNIMQHVKRSSPQFKKSNDKSQQYYTKEEVETILNDTCQGCSEHELQRYPFTHLLVHLGLLLGLRSGELMCLKVSDFDMQNRTVTIQRSITRGVISTTKTGTTRTIPLVDRLYKKLQEYFKNHNSQWLFPSPTGKPYTYSRTIVDHRFKPLLKRLNISYKGFYQMRHTFSSLAVLNGVPMPIVSQCLGHKSIATTQKHYLRFGNIDHQEIKKELENLIA